MAKLTTNNITSRYGSVDGLNDNFSAIEVAFENTLSRDGTSPNYMEADLDMNSNSILNANNIYTSSLYLNGTAVQLNSTLQLASVQVFEFIAVAGQTSYAVSPLTPNTNALQVEVNGLALPNSSVSVSGSTISFPALAENDEVVVRVFNGAISGAATTDEITYPPSYTGAVTRTLSARLEDNKSVKDFGAVGDGVTDDSVAIQNACDTGGTIYFPVGTYKVTSTITVNVDGTRLVGAGMYDTIITRSADYGNTFFFTGNDATGVQLLNSGISHMTITATNLMSSGAHVHLNGLQRFEASDLYLRDGFIGMICRGVAGGHVSRIYCVHVNLFGGSATGRKYLECGQTPSTLYPRRVSGDLFFTDTNWRGNVTYTITQIGVHILGGDGIWFQNGHVGNTTFANICIDNALTGTDSMLTLLFFSQFMSDEHENFGLLFRGNSQTIAFKYRFTNCDFRAGPSALALHNIATSTTALFNDISFVGCSVHGAMNHGIIIQSPDFTHITFTGCHVNGNSFTTPGVASGYFLGAGVRDISIVGGCTGRGRLYPTDPATQAYGVSAAGAAGPILITGVDLTDNLSSGVLLPASGAKVSGCMNGAGALSIASATTLPYIDDTFSTVTITGTTTITNITASISGREVTLVFSSTAQVTDGGNLKLAGNFTGGADRTLKLVSDGTYWIEVSRSTN